MQYAQEKPPRRLQVGKKKKEKIMHNKGAEKITDLI